ncbi:phosphohydrolase [Pullulanibacillus camelliae]|uniref:Phosphohydrolase n=1 Tax=Pullulanibacillus camelliae TaxID=1707096 RepID=A0A8J2VMT0_9BACL|nr:HAD-IA family hydrolase [Pullulanibacillus camelliae]GGE32249.1 phosphohydrolase [Pullulanibacillus camelliae]
MKTIVFDFDGTLANTLPIIVSTFQHLFRTYKGVTASAEEVMALFGPTEEGMLHDLLPEEDWAQAERDLYTYYRQYQSQQGEADPDIIALLDYVKKKGVKLAIFTGKGRCCLDISLEYLQIEHYFDVMITGDDVARPKPNSEGLRKAIDLCDATPAETIYVGDSDADIAAGKSAGVLTVGACWMERTQSEHFIQAPDRVYQQVSDFLNDLKHQHI